MRIMKDVAVRRMQKESDVKSERKKRGQSVVLKKRREMPNGRRNGRK